VGPSRSECYEEEKNIPVPRLRHNEQQTPWSSPRANYTDRETAACRAKLVPTIADRGCRSVSATDPHGRILDFLDRNRYYFFQVAPQLYSRG
jgi:hypothetical protein